jgi:hypothetical protein
VLCNVRMKSPDKTEKFDIVTAVEGSVHLECKDNTGRIADPLWESKDFPMLDKL